MKCNTTAPVWASVPMLFLFIETDAGFSNAVKPLPVTHRSNSNSMAHSPKPIAHYLKGGNPCQNI